MKRTLWRGTAVALAMVSPLLSAQSDATAEAQPPESAAAETLPGIPVAREPEPTPAAEDAVELEPITTVATRTPRNALDVPASVSIVSAREIEELQSSDLGEVLKGLPGIGVAGGPRANAESINIRGLSGTRVLLSVDGARQNFDGAHRSRLLVDPELVKSVDVLRGPASALWGSDALGGVVALATKDAADLLRPGDRLGLRLKTGFESANDETLGGGTAFGRLGDFDWLANVAIRQTGDLRQGDGAVLPHSALDDTSGLYKASWLPGNDHEAGVSFQRFSQSGRSPSNPTQEVDADNPLLDRRNDQHYLSARYGYEGAGRLSGAQVNVYRTSLDIVEDRVDAPRHDTLAFVTQGASAQSSFAFDALTQRLTLGMEAYRDESQAMRDGAPRPQFPDAERQVMGVFVQDEVGLGRGWSLIPGVRYDRVEAASNTGAARDTSDDELSLKLAAAWSLTDWLSLHAGYGEAFRAPSLLETYAAGTHFLGNEFRPNPGLRPEDARNVEAGVRLYFADAIGAGDTLRFKATLFDNDVADYIETVVVVESAGPFPPPAQCVSPAPAVGCVNRNDDGTLNPAVPPVFVGGYTTSENLTNAVIDGAELEAAWSIAGVALGLNYTRTRGDNSVTGAPLLSIPADTLNGSLGYRAGGVHAGVRVTRAAAQDRVPLDSEGNPVIPRTGGYTVADLFVSWEPAAAEGLKLNVGVDNVADRLYRNHLAPLAEAGINPRASLSYQF